MELAIEEIEARRMPPAQVESDFAMLGTQSPTAEQLAMLREWVATDMPAGDSEKTPDLPPLPNYEAFQEDLGPPDIVIEQQSPTQLGAHGDDLYRNVIFPLGNTEDLAIRALQFLPGNQEIVHHALTGYLPREAGEEAIANFGGRQGMSHPDDQAGEQVEDRVLEIRLWHARRLFAPHLVAIVDAALIPGAATGIHEHNLGGCGGRECIREVEVTVGEKGEVDGILVAVAGDLLRLVKLADHTHEVDPLLVELLVELGKNRRIPLCERTGGMEKGVADGLSVALKQIGKSRFATVKRLGDEQFRGDELWRLFGSGRRGLVRQRRTAPGRDNGHCPQDASSQRSNSPDVSLHPNAASVTC